MTQGTASSLGRSLELRFLEYGKLCSRRDGPIVPGADFQSLTWSEGVPEALIRWLQPSLIGPSSAGGGRLPSTVRTSWLLRPIYTKDRRWWTVSARVEKRPEGTGSRWYDIARYAVVSEGRAWLDPYIPYVALYEEKGPLVGLDKVGIATRPPPLTARVQEPAGPDESALAFVEGALQRVMSGVAVWVDGAVPLAQFVDWTSSLWWAIPPALRRHFSAGHGVSSGLAKHLMVACGPGEPGPEVARYHPKTGWRDPSLVESGKPFVPARLHPGRAYLHELAASDLRAAVEREGRIPRLESDLIGESDWEEASREVDALPSFVDPKTVRLFRRPGLLAMDRGRLSAFRRWLRAADDNPAPLSLQGTFFNETRTQLLDAVMEGMTEEASAERARRFLHAERARNQAVFDQGVAEHAGIALMWALAGERSVATSSRICALALAAAQAGALHSPLAPDVERRLHGSLKLELEQQAWGASSARELLRVGHEAEGAPSLRAWYSKHRYEILARACFVGLEPPDGGHDAYERDRIRLLQGLVSKPDRYEPPERYDELIGTGAFRDALGQLVRQLVMKRGGAQSRALVAWVRRLDLHEDKLSPLFRVKRDPSLQLSDEELRRAKREFLAPAPPLVDAVAHWVLRHLDQLVRVLGGQVIQVYSLRWDSAYQELFDPTDAVVGRPDGEPWDAEPLPYHPQLLEQVLNGQLDRRRLSVRALRLLAQLIKCRRTEPTAKEALLSGLLFFLEGRVPGLEAMVSWDRVATVFPLFASIRREVELPLPASDPLGEARSERAKLLYVQAWGHQPLFLLPHLLRFSLDEGFRAQLAQLIAGRESLASWTRFQLQLAAGGIGGTRLPPNGWSDDIFGTSAWLLVKDIPRAFRSSLSFSVLWPLLEGTRDMELRALEISVRFLSAQPGGSEERQVYVESILRSVLVPIMARRGFSAKQVSMVVGFFTGDEHYDKVKLEDWAGRFVLAPTHPIRVDARLERIIDQLSSACDSSRVFEALVQAVAREICR